MQKIVSAYIRRDQSLADWDEVEYVCYFEADSVDEEEDELDYLTGTNLRRIIREAKDSACKRDYTHISIYLECEHLETVRLILSPRRKKEAAELAEQERKQREAWEITSSLISRYEALAKGIRRGLTSRRISAFYRAWKSVTGYGVDVDGTLKKALQPAKQSLIQALLERARNEKWIHGTSVDFNARNAYRKVVYVDTPEGQVSFHVLPDDYQGLPRYNGVWSGKRDSDQILKRLYSPATMDSCVVEGEESGSSELRKEAA